MATRWRGRRLGWIFALVVLVPGVLLAVIAVRSINREEAYIEKQLQGTLLAEVIHLVSLAESELSLIEAELAESAPQEAGADAAAAFAGWREASALVSSPFLLSPEFEILWPSSARPLEEDQESFLRRNSEFLSNRAEVPVFEDITGTYREQINVMQGSDSEKRSEPVQRQLAKSRFQMSEEVQERIYEQAEEEGLTSRQRILLPSAAGAEENEQPPPSLFISRDLRLEEITKEKDQGLIPRFAEESLHLLFWKRRADGRLVGCMLEDSELRARLVTLIPELYNPVRILTLVDEKGRPLVAPQESQPRDYSRPFAARELSALLPLWEAAAYLTDPQTVSAQALRVSRILWTLISILFVSILVGGILVLRAVQAESLLARQKTTFVANVSHELKTPLTSIRMFAEMLKSGRQRSEERRREYLGLMLSESERLTRLINNVLDFSRMEQGQRRYDRRRLDLWLLCRELLDNQRPRCRQNGFALDLRRGPARGSEPEGTPGPADGGEGFWVRADAESIRQALLNLLSNAEKYSQSRKEIEVELYREPSWICIEVKDRGRGIPAAQARRIFEEFYRVDDSLTARVRGSGLGLSITRRIISDHHGEICHLPREGGGSIFRIKLPAADAA